MIDQRAERQTTIMGSIIIELKLQEFAGLITMWQPDSQEDLDQSRPHLTLAG